MFDITLTWYTLHSGFPQVFVLQVTQKDSTGVFCMYVTGDTQGLCRCFVCVHYRLLSGNLQVFCFRLHSVILQVFCFRLHSGILRVLQVTFRDSTDVCVCVTVTLRVSTGVLCVCCRLH